MTCHCCSWRLTFPWQPYFDRHVSELQFALFKIKNRSFLVVFLSYKNSHFVMFLFVLVTFESFLNDLSRFRKNLLSYDFIISSCLIMRLKEIFSDYLPFQCRCHSILSYGGLGGGGVA